MSNSSLLDLTDILTRDCSPTSLPVAGGFLGRDVPTAWLPLNNDTYGGLSAVCSPNPVNLYLGCALWCELPTAYMENYKKSGYENLGSYFRATLKDTGMNMSSFSISSAQEHSVAALPSRPPSLVALGMLLLVTLGILRL